VLTTGRLIYRHHRSDVTSRRRCEPAGGVTMGWLLRLVTGGGTGVRGPPTVLEFLVINFSVCLALLSNIVI